MSVEYKNRGILHKLTSGRKFHPQKSSHKLIKLTAKTALAAETTALFAKDLVVNRFVGKETHIRFERKQNKHGKYRTHIKLVRGEASERPQGILHKVFALDRFIEGDKPQIIPKKPRIRNISKKSKIPKVKRLKKSPARIAAGTVLLPVRTASGVTKTALKASGYTLKKSAKASKAVLLTSETAVRKAGSVGLDQFKRKLRSSSELSDGGRAAMASITTLSMLNQGRKYLVSYRRKRAVYKQKKNTFKNQKKKFKSVKKAFKAEKKEYKAQKKHLKSKLQDIRKAEKTTDKKIENIRKAKKTVIKKRLNQQKKLQKNSRKTFRNEKKQKNLAKKEKKDAKVVPLAALPLVPSAAIAKQLSASYLRKISSADPNNDFLQAGEKIGRGTKTVAKTAKSVNSKIRQKQTQKHSDKLHKEQNRLNEKKGGLQKRKRKPNKKQKNARQKAAEKSRAAAKKASKEAKKAIGDAAKLAFKIIGIFLLPILAIIFGLCIFMLMFTGSAGNNAYILGTYNAQDRYLSWGCEHYTKIAYDFNESLMKIATDQWTDGLNELGVDTSSYGTSPTSVIFGKSVKYSQEPHYSYDDDKLASFLCAYYYVPQNDTDDIQNWEWEDEDEIDEVLRKLFDKQYTFQHQYEDKSGWNEYNKYISFGGGGSETGKYYSVYKDGFSKSKMKICNIPSEIEEFGKDGYLYYDNNTLEVLDANNGNKKTGYFIQDQRYYVQDPNGNLYKPFYTKHFVPKSEIEKYIRNGKISYRTYTHDGKTIWSLLDPDTDKETGYFIEDINAGTKKYYKYKWAHGRVNGNIRYENHSILSISGKEIYYVVSGSDTQKWCGKDDVYLISFYRKNYWSEECNLYYTVQTNCTFDEAVEDILMELDDGQARAEFYHILAESDDPNVVCPFGFHQLMDAPLGGRAIQNYIDTDRIYHRFGYNVKEWNQKNEPDGNHKGIDISAIEGEMVFAMMDGYVEWVDEDKNSLSIRGMEEFWYDESIDRATAIKYSNIKTHLKKGSKVKIGQYIGSVTTKKHCFDDWDIGADKTYLHIEVAIEYGRFLFWGNDWSEVNPLYLMYRNENEAEIG